MSKYFIYPNIKPNATSMTNSYICDFKSSIRVYYECMENENTKGIFEVFSNKPQNDIYIFNWIENLPDRKYGILQSLFFVFAIYFINYKKKIIIYVLHNRMSHNNGYRRLKQFLLTLCLKKSSLIITHSSDGETIAKRRGAKNVYYFPHPIKNINIAKVNLKPKYDILIWGNITPYKGIEEFLLYLKKNNMLSKYKVLIIGRFANNELFNRYVNIVEGKIEIINEFVSQATLNKVMSEVKLVLFTYLESTVLSSGVLIDTISYGKKVIGPDHGAFKDLKKDNIITTYTNYQELINIIDSSLSIDYSDKTIENIIEYYNKYNWEEFGKNLNQIINKVNNN